jgi:hypothetical protein
VGTVELEPVNTGVGKSLDGLFDAKVPILDATSLQARIRTLLVADH